MKILSIVSPKGGTGKSALAIALAVATARKVRTALYDLDPQASAARWFLNHRSPAVAAGRIRQQQPLLLRRPPLAELASSIVTDAEAPDTPVHWAVCDTAGGAFRALAEVARISDLLLVPLQPSIPDLATVPRLMSFIAELHDPPPLAVLLTRVHPRSATRIAFARDMLAESGIRCLDSAISQSVIWQDAYEEGRSPQEMPIWRSLRPAGEIVALLKEITSIMERNQANGRAIETARRGGAEAAV